MILTKLNGIFEQKFSSVANENVADLMQFI